MAQLDELSVEIGSIRATLEHLAATVERNQEASTAEHRKVHEIVDATAEAVRNLDKAIREMKPLTDDYRERRAEGRGAAKFVRALYVTGGGLAGAFASRALDWLATGRPPHP